MTGLSLHAGANRVEFKDVEAVVTPEPCFRGEKARRKFYPIPHAALVRSVSSGLEEQGFIIGEQSHALVKNGARYFGLMKVRHHNEQEASDFSSVIGLRNGHDGSFLASLAVGANIFVCDNLSFSGEVTIGRKHTRYIERDLPGLIFSAIGKLGGQRQQQGMRFAAYKQAQLQDRDAHSLILRSFTTGIIGEQRIKGVLNQWERPQHEEFQPRTVWSLFNAFTELFKPQERKDDSGNMILGQTNLGQLGGRTMKLHGLLDAYVGVKI